MRSNKAKSVERRRREVAAKSEATQQPDLGPGSSVLPPETPMMRGVAYSQTRVHRGPLPTASEFTSYEAALPGSADRILRMAESAQKHSQELSSQALTADTNDRRHVRLLDCLGKLLATGVVIYTVYSGATGSGEWAKAIAGIQLVGIIGAIVYGRTAMKAQQGADTKQ